MDYDIPLILRTDSYKASHFRQYPPGTTRVSSYIEARGGAYAETVFFGLQAFLKRYMTPITIDDVRRADAFWTAHGEPFDLDMWSYIATDLDGKLPVEISALPEGTVTGLSVPMVQIVNTDPRCAPLVSYLETALLRAVWYPTTVATLSREVKKRIWQGLLETSDDPEGQIGFKLHDFGARGASSAETAMLGGMAHLVNFLGSDTVEGVMGARMFYGEEMAGFSIPATEHSTMTAWGKDGEVEAYRALLRAHPTGLVACVSDSYDIWNAVRNIWGGVLKDEVMARDGTLVIRPDSGDPTGVPLDVIELAMERFGSSVNAKGYRVLPDQVRVIQGDGMTPETISQLLANAADRGISVDNFAMGMGGGLLQKVDRDTLKFAMKASAVEVNGVWRDVAKDPVTDRGKASKAGRQAVLRIDGDYVPRRLDDLPKDAGHGCQSWLKPVWRNGDLLREVSFADVRERARL